MKKTILLLSLFLMMFGCGGGSKPSDPLTNFKPNKAELGEDWGQFKHDTSFGVWVFKHDQPRPQEHRTPKQVRVFWDGSVTDEEKSLIDTGLTEMLKMCRRDTNKWSPGNIWTKFPYFQDPSDYKVLFVTSNYTLQEGEAAGCAGLITGAQGIFTAAGTVGGLNERVNSSMPGSKGGVYIIIPKQSPEQLARSECKTLMKNAVRNEAEHVWMTNETGLYFSHANDGYNGNHPYCTGME